MESFVVSDSWGSKSYIFHENEQPKVFKTNG